MSRMRRALSASSRRVSSPISVSATTNSAADESQGDGTAVRPAIDVAGEARDRRQPLVGEQHDRARRADAPSRRSAPGCPGSGGCRRSRSTSRLPMSISRSRQLLSWPARWKHVRPDDRQMRGHVAGDRIGEAAADQEDARRRVGQAARRCRRSAWPRRGGRSRGYSRASPRPSAACRACRGTAATGPCATAGDCNCAASSS